MTPLSWAVKRKSITEETAKWGLYTVAVSWAAQIRPKARSNVSFRIVDTQVHQRRRFFGTRLDPSIFYIHKWKWGVEVGWIRYIEFHERRRCSHLCTLDEYYCSEVLLTEIYRHTAVWYPIQRATLHPKSTKEDGKLSSGIRCPQWILTALEY